MSRRLIALLVSLMLACSGLQAVARALAPAQGDGPAVAHQLSPGHHHHADAIGDGEGAAQLFECDDGASDPALQAQAWLPIAPPAPSAAPAEPAGPAIPTPYLDGLMRPPRR